MTDLPDEPDWREEARWATAALARALEENERLRECYDDLETVLDAEAKASSHLQERLAEVSYENEKLRKRLTALKDDIDVSVDWILEEKDRVDAAKEEVSKQRQENAALLEENEGLREENERIRESYDADVDGLLASLERWKRKWREKHQWAWLWKQAAKQRRWDAQMARKAMRNQKWHIHELVTAVGKLRDTGEQLEDRLNRCIQQRSDWIGKANRYQKALEKIAAEAAHDEQEAQALEDESTQPHNQAYFTGIVAVLKWLQVEINQALTKARGES